MFKRLLALALGITLLGCVFYAWQIEPKRLTVDAREIRLDRWPSKLDGFRIVQLSDLHMSQYGVIEHKAVDASRRLKPDMIVLTGDYIGRRLVKTTPQMRDDFLEMIRNLHAPYGVWAILGNNDTREIAPLLEKGGVHALLDRHSYIQARGTGFRLIGVSDPGEIPDLTLAFAGLPQDGAKILITHTPDSAVFFPKLATGVDLALFGHTHGGQLRLPIIGALMSPLDTNFPLAGEFRFGKTKCYVNQGLGMNWVPLRFQCPPQISLLVIRAKNRPPLTGNRPVFMRKS